MDRTADILVAGADQPMGGALLRQLERQGYDRVQNHKLPEPDYRDRADVERYFEQHHPSHVLLAAGKSGGIGANQSMPADLMTDNLVVATNVIGAAHRHGTQKLLYLASSCIYPRCCPQPMAVDALFSGPLEPTNEAYALAKLAGLTLCRAYQRQYNARFMTAILADVFGPGADFSPANSHVVPALIRKMHEAKQEGRASVVLWGSGEPKREFCLTDDLADACLTVMRKYNGPGPINIGVGQAMTIREIAEIVQEVTGFSGALQFDPEKPDGMPVKQLDSTELAALGWRPMTSIRDAVAVTYEWYLSSTSTQSS